MFRFAVRGWGEAAMCGACMAWVARRQRRSTLGREQFSYHQPLLVVEYEENSQKNVIKGMKTKATLIARKEVSTKQH